MPAFATQHQHPYILPLIDACYAFNEYRQIIGRLTVRHRGALECDGCHTVLEIQSWVHAYQKYE
ncbi:hypothetical protein SDC9_174387 [bioreactor metagenome]|uniref:Uncharacterized protein n=1 Tax=bioreactor metagenome TaxID=1076179 RepID=A0A645GJ04_9ZZZZ